MITTVGIFPTHAYAKDALRELREIGVEENEISYVYLNTEDKLVDDPNTQKDDAQSVITSSLGLTFRKGTVPEIGPLFAAGPLAAKLGFTGEAASGFVGACSGFGINEKDALRFHDYLKSGDILVIVCLATSGPKDIFTRAHAREVQEYADQ